MNKGNPDIPYAEYRNVYYTVRYGLVDEITDEEAQKNHT